MWAGRRGLALLGRSMLLCPGQEPTAAQQLRLLAAWQARWVSSSPGGGPGSESEVLRGPASPAADAESPAAAAGGEAEEPAGAAPPAAQPPAAVDVDDLTQLPRTEPRPGLTGSAAWAPVQGLAPVRDRVAPEENIEDMEALMAQWRGLVAGGGLQAGLPLMEQPLGPEAHAPEEEDEDEEDDEVADEEEGAVQALRPKPGGGTAPRVRVREVVDGRAYATGKRKAATAQVWLFQGVGNVTINRRPIAEYFPAIPKRADVYFPFQVTGTLGHFDVTASVRGGGISGQSQAIRHGISQALQKWEPALRPSLRSFGLLTRDPREVERKKPGRKKARKAFQWVKR